MCKSAMGNDECYLNNDTKYYVEIHDYHGRRTLYPGTQQYNHLIKGGNYYINLTMRFGRSDWPDQKISLYGSEYSGETKYISRLFKLPPETPPGQQIPSPPPPHQRTPSPPPPRKQIPSPPPPHQRIPSPPPFCQQTHSPPPPRQRTCSPPPPVPHKPGAPSQFQGNSKPQTSKGFKGLYRYSDDPRVREIKEMQEKKRKEGQQKLWEIEAEKGRQGVEERKAQRQMQKK